jgi:hypothetical protein
VTRAQCLQKLNKAELRIFGKPPERSNIQGIICITVPLYYEVYADSSLKIKIAKSVGVDIIVALTRLLCLTYIWRERGVLH